MKSLTSAFAAALIASAAFAGTAFADEGDYYQGASETAVVDTMQTGSITKQTVHQDNASQDLTKSNQNRGDYYEGANRPN